MINPSKCTCGPNDACNICVTNAQFRSVPVGLTPKLFPTPTRDSLEVKDVYFKNRDGQVVSVLRYDPVTRKISLDAVDIRCINLRDLQRVYSFWRRIQSLRYSA